jgi:hypothetical protein
MFGWLWCEWALEKSASPYSHFRRSPPRPGYVEAAADDADASAPRHEGNNNAAIDKLKLMTTIYRRNSQRTNVTQKQ